MDEDNVLEIKRDMANPRVLLYTYDENFGEIKSFDINGVSFSADDSNLSECFKIKFARTCTISVPREHQLSELNVTAENMWKGTATTTLPEIDETQLNLLSPGPIHFLFESVIYDWIIILLVLILVGYFVHRIVKSHSKRN